MKLNGKSETIERVDTLTFDIFGTVLDLEVLRGGVAGHVVVAEGVAALDALALERLALGDAPRDQFGPRLLPDVLHPVTATGLWIDARQHKEAPLDVAHDAAT